MKKSLIIFGLILLSFIGYSQNSEFDNIGINESIYSGSSLIMIPNPDSIGQFIWYNFSDPETDLQPVNKRYFINALIAFLDTAHVVNEDDPIYAGDSIKIAWLSDLVTMHDSLSLLADSIRALNDTIDYLLNYTDTTVYSITLPYSTSVAGRILLATEGTDYPTGWTLVGDGLNLVVTHNLGRWVTNVTVWANTTGVQRQQLFNTAAHNGVTCTDDDNVTIYSLATISKPIIIYLAFE
jgi:hypothetical protein